MKSIIGAALAACLVAQASDLSKQLVALDHERDPGRLEAAAVAIAASGDAAAVGQLARHLGERPFLQRLGASHLAPVFRALAEHPTPAGEALCVALARNREFTSIGSRLNYLLNALAAVRPVSDTAAAVFRDTSHQGYLEVNGPLLARNGSPRALQVLEELFRDESLDVAQRVSMAHWSLLPVRTDPAVDAMASRLALSDKLSSDMRVAIIESLFDYQPRRWFGVALQQPKPPAWASAPQPAKESLRALGMSLEKRSDLPSALQSAIQATLDQL